MRNGRRFLERFWQTDWSLSALLVLILVDTFVTAPLLQSRDTTGVLLFQLSIFSVFLLSGVAFAFRNPALTAMVGAFAAGAFLVRWTNHFHPNSSLARIESGLSLVFCVLLGAVILIQVLRSGPINAQRIQGAVALYLLLARVWTFAYVLVALGDSRAFSFPAEGLHPQVLHARLLYFSIMTLTTVGYGDITPVNPIAGSLAALEGMIGQLFPVLLLARLVSMELYHQQQRGR
ncbi:MAG TPA: hypothetical protein DEP35_09760 [Deltaproteobacteria bacterium]|jgi:voltage-gated potassium channel Kch|nr:hypothetical protein [Deltaproteobacteria bacterium]